MRQTFVFPSIGIAALAMMLAFAAPTYAETVQLKADLKGASEVPPNQSTGTGTVTVTFDAQPSNCRGRATIPD